MCAGVERISWDALPQRPADELLERDAELATLAAVAERARSGSGGLLVIEGPAGIGKTRLLDAGLERARATGLEIATAKASELERDFPFGVARQLFEPLLAALDTAVKDDVVAGPAGLGVQALSELRSAEIPPSTETLYPALHGLYWLAANLAATKPLLVAVDDAHWSDGPSLRFLAYLAKRIQGVPASLVLVRRPAEPGAEAEILDEIASDPGALLVKPPPLSEAAVAEFVRAGLSPDADGSFCSACHRATRGNPFLLRELLTALAEEGVSGTGEDAGRVSDLAPETVAKSVLRRLARLPGEAAATARAVAILGDGAERALVARLAGLDELPVAEAAEALARIDIFRPGDAMAFSHPVVRAAVYSSLSAAERAEGHRAAARILAESHRDLDRTATHLLATEPSADPWALEVLREAGRAAVARGAPDIGTIYLNRALLETPSDEVRADLLVELGLAEVAATPPPAGIEHMRQALALTSDPRTRARISLEIGRAYFASVQFPTAAQVLERALSELGDEDHHLAEQLEGLLLTACVTNLATASRARKRLPALLEEAEAGKLSDPSLLATVAVFATAVKEPAAGGAELARRTLAGGQLVAAQDMVALPFAACALMFADQSEVAMRVWEEALAAARRKGSVAMFVFASAFRSHAAWRLGSISTAEADARAALEVAAVREAEFGLPFVIGTLVDALIERGELEAAGRSLTESGIDGPIPELLHLNFVLDSRGRLRLAQGRAREALDDFLECGRREEGWGIRNPGSMTWRSSAALALSSLGEREDGLRLALEEAELARGFEVPRELGIALRAAGLIEGGETGIARLREAVHVLEGSSAALERARALTDLGAAVRRSGRRADARTPLRQGLELAQRCGAHAVARRAHAELVASGARPRRVALRGVEALTASERRVAEMAAEGQSNREIAQALFVTEKTIEWHLSQAYRKLDIRSRSELGALVKRAPGPPGEGGVEGA